MASPTLAGTMPTTRRAWRRLGRVIGDRLPKGLYARSLIIIIARWCCCNR